jgi:hypothetical protein
VSDVRDLVINLVAAVIVFVAGVLTRGFFQLARPAWPYVLG